jgi:hypothetical protein
MLIADIPEIPETEQEPIVLEVRNNTSFERPMEPEPLDTSDSNDVSANPIELAISPRNNAEPTLQVREDTDFPAEPRPKLGTIRKKNRPRRNEKKHDVF